MKGAVVRYGAEAAQEQLAGRQERGYAFRVMGNHPRQKAAARGTQSQLRRKRKRIPWALQSGRTLAPLSHRRHYALEIIVGEPRGLDEDGGLDERFAIDIGQHRPARRRLG